MKYNMWCDPSMLINGADSSDYKVGECRKPGKAQFSDDGDGMTWYKWWNQSDVSKIKFTFKDSKNEGKHFCTIDTIAEDPLTNSPGWLNVNLPALSDVIWTYDKKGTLNGEQVLRYKFSSDYLQTMSNGELLVLNSMEFQSTKQEQGPQLGFSVLQMSYKIRIELDKSSDYGVAFSVQSVAYSEDTENKTIPNSSTFLNLDASSADQVLIC